MKKDRWLPMLEAAILQEREACAKIADDHCRTICEGGCGGNCIHERIRSRPHPSIKVVRPETAAKNPEAAKGALVLGVGMSDDGEIIGHWPAVGAKKAIEIGPCPESTLQAIDQHFNGAPNKPTMRTDAVGTTGCRATVSTRDT
jgi:hypothetical protein